jgi:hypothetical protein
MDNMAVEVMQARRMTAGPLEMQAAHEDVNQGYRTKSMVMRGMKDRQAVTSQSARRCNTGAAYGYSMQRGGGIESRGKTKGTVIRMASGGSVSARADGIAQRGKTKFKSC